VDSIEFESDSFKKQFFKVSHGDPTKCYSDAQNFVDLMTMFAIAAFMV